MYLFRILALLSIFIITTTATARFKHTKQQHLPDINVLQNPGFESGSAKWTKTAGTWAKVNDSAGNSSITWDAAAADNLMASVSRLVPRKLAGNNNCAASLWYEYESGDGSAGDYQIEVWDGTNILVQSDLPITVDWEEKFVVFTCPAFTGSMTFRLRATTDAGAIDIDDTWLGSNMHRVDIAQAKEAGYLRWASTDCTWSHTTGALMEDFAVDPDCDAINIRGAAAEGATKLPAIRFPNGLQAGVYQVIATGRIQSGSNQECFYSIYDGTTEITSYSLTVTSTMPNVLNVVRGSFEYTEAQGDTTFRIRVAEGSGSSGCHIYASGGDTNQKDYLDFTVNYFPSGSESGISGLNTKGMFWNGYHDSDCVFTRAVAAIGDFTGDASCTFTERSSNNMSGTVASTDDGANTNPGVEFVAKRAGWWEGCVSFQVFHNTINNHVSLYLTDGSNNELESNSLYPNGVSDRNIQRFCGVQYASDTTTPIIFKMRASIPGSQTLTMQSDGGSARTANWTIRPFTQNMPDIIPTPDISSFVRLDTGHGMGDGSHSMIRDFANVTEKAGDCISENVTGGGSDTDGAVLTINCDGVYAMSYTDVGDGANVRWGISVNSTELTTVIQSITTTDRLIWTAENANGWDNCGVTVPLNSGDLIRPHTDGEPDLDSGLEIFVITRVH